MGYHLLVPLMPIEEESAGSWPRLQPCVWRLQPYVMEDATVCNGGCNRVWLRLQPYVAEAATVRDGGCNRT